MNEDKIKESEFFLTKLKNYQFEIEHFDYYFSAFLSSCRSISDHLLEHYNQKFSLGIGSKEKLTQWKFFEEATKKENPDALHFIEWYTRELQKNKQDPIWVELNNNRNSNIHKKLLKSDIEGAEIIVDGVLHSTFQRAKGVPREDIEDVIKHHVSEIDGSISIKLRFEVRGLESQDGYDVCQKYLEKMKNFSKEAESKFG